MEEGQGEFYLNCSGMQDRIILCGAVNFRDEFTALALAGGIGILAVVRGMIRLLQINLIVNGSTCAITCEKVNVESLVLYV